MSRRSGAGPPTGQKDPGGGGSSRRPGPAMVVSSSDLRSGGAAAPDGRGRPTTTSARSLRMPEQQLQQPAGRRGEPQEKDRHTSDSNEQQHYDGNVPAVAHSNSSTFG